MTAPPSPETLRLTNGVVEVRVPARYGPRVTHYGFADGPNLFGHGAGVQRETPRGTWRAYGGHRLWAAPERFPETYTIDDRPPAVESSERRVVLRRARDPQTGLAVSMEIELEPVGTEVLVRHAIANEAGAPRELAPWSLTVMRPGGVGLIPNPERRSQREALLPARTLALWSYTDLSDAREAAVVKTSDCLDTPGRKQSADRARRDGKEYGFDNKLPCQPHPRGPKCRAQRDLFAAGGRPNQKQIRNV